MDWENARIFLELARHKSIRAASGALGMSVNAMRRRLETLESQLGATLITRHVDGIRLTQEGDRVLTVAERMEADAFDLVRAAAKSESPRRSVVRLAITEGLGSFWVAPRMVDFLQQNPDVIVDMRCAMMPADVLRLEADVAIQLEQPQQKDVRIVKLGRMHLMLFAAESYLEKRGRPKSKADLFAHTIVEQAAAQLIPIEDYERQLSSAIAHVSLRSNVSSAHYLGIASGVGVGLLPTYAVALGGAVVPLDIDYHTYQDIWLAYHPDVNRIPRVRKLIDWLIALFSAQRYPWFGDRFIHPNDFPHDGRGLPPIGIFGPFAGPQKASSKVFR